MHSAGLKISAISTPRLNDNFCVSIPASKALNLLIGANKSNRRGKQK